MAVHSTIANAALLVAAGVDSIEHGTGLDKAAIADMARRGTAWTRTVSALDGVIDSPDLPPAAQQELRERRQRLGELLPLATRLGVPVLAGTDVTGSIPQEVALLAELGLEPQDAIAAASVRPRKFLEVQTQAADLVTYQRDPRQDPSELGRPAAVVLHGKRVR